jgi:hypothetical protein
MTLDAQYGRKTIPVAVPTLLKAKGIATISGIGTKSSLRQVRERKLASGKVTSGNRLSINGLISFGGRHPRSFQGPLNGNDALARLGEKNPIRGPWCNE